MEGSNALSHLSDAKLYELSITDLITLLFLKIRGRKTVRYNLFIDVRNYLNTKLSTSSFYNSLEKLEGKGLINFERNEKGKVKYVSPQDAEIVSVINLILKNLFLLQLADYPPTYTDLFQHIVRKLQKMEFQNTLSVWLEDYIDSEVISLMAMASTETFVLSKRKIYDERVDKRDFKNIRHSSIFDGKIREPNGVFEAIVLPYYLKTFEFENLTRVNLLAELKRVLRENGSIVLITRKIIPQFKTHSVNESINVITRAIEERFFTQKELQEDLTSAGFRDIDVSEFQGLLIGLAYR
jgi:DNA-binding PadR family transcriptional regulator